MTNNTMQTLKGFRDFLPSEARKRQFVINTLRKVFESYGFEPLETPSLEYEEILLGKYGKEGDYCPEIFVRLALTFHWEAYERDLARIARLSTMGELASVLAHELNQPLAAIVNFSRGALRRLNARDPAQDDVKGALDKVSAEAMRASEK